MKKSHKSLLKNIFSVLAVVVFGFILLNLAFLFDFVYQTIARGIIEYITPLEPGMNVPWFPPLMHFSFLIVIGIISWFILRSKLWKVLKAVYLCVPVVAVQVTIGIFFYPNTLLVYSLGALFCLGVVYYLHRTKKPWLYYFTTIFWPIVVAAYTLSGGEI